MESSLKELAGYRLARAREMLSASEGNLKIGQYKTSLNRSYYNGMGKKKIKSSIHNYVKRQLLNNGVAVFIIGIMNKF